MAIPIIIEGKPIAKWSRLSGNRSLKKSSIQQLVRHIGLPLVMTANPINIAVNPIMKPPFLLICRLTAKVSGWLKASPLERRVRPEGQKGAPSLEDVRGP